MLIYIYHNMKFATPETINDSIAFDDFALGLLDEDDAERIATDLPSLNALPLVYRPDADADDDAPSSSSSAGDSSSGDSSDAADSSDDAGGDDPEVLPIPIAEPSLSDIVPPGYVALIEPPSGELTAAHVQSNIMMKTTVLRGAKGNQCI